MLESNMPYKQPYTVHLFLASSRKKEKKKKIFFVLGDGVREVMAAESTDPECFWSFTSLGNLGCGAVVLEPYQLGVILICAWLCVLGHVT